MIYYRVSLAASLLLVGGGYFYLLNDHISSVTWIHGNYSCKNIINFITKIHLSALYMRCFLIFWQLSIIIQMHICWYLFGVLSTIYTVYAIVVVFCFCLFSFFSFSFFLCVCVVGGLGVGDFSLLRVVVGFFLYFNFFLIHRQKHTLNSILFLWWLVLIRFYIQN